MALTILLQDKLALLKQILPFFSTLDTKEQIIDEIKKEIDFLEQVIKERNDKHGTIQITIK